MIKKIKAALQQGQYKNLGLSDKAFEGAAAYIATSITDEAEIETKVNSDEVKALLKSFQSVADEARAKKNEPTPQPSDPANNPEPKPEPTPQPNPQDLAKTIADAVAAAIKPLSDELAGYKAEKAVSDTVADVNTRIDAWGYGKGFPKEMEKARKNAMEIYEAYGKKWTADELEAKIKEKFNQEVHDKGIDTTQPFKSDGGAGEAKADFTPLAERLRAKGMLPKDNTNQTTN